MTTREEWEIIREAVDDVTKRFKRITGVNPVDLIDVEGSFYQDIVDKTHPTIKEYVFKKYPDFTMAMYEEFLYGLDDSLMQKLCR